LSWKIEERRWKRKAKNDLTDCTEQKETNILFIAGEGLAMKNNSASS
jgi:hypothetical protein